MDKFNALAHLCSSQLRACARSIAKYSLTQDLYLDSPQILPLACHIQVSSDAVNTIYTSIERGPTAVSTSTDPPTTDQITNSRAPILSRTVT
jgi:hypothetical protein